MHDRLVGQLWWLTLSFLSELSRVNHREPRESLAGGDKRDVSFTFTVTIKHSSNTNAVVIVIRIGEGLMVKLVQQSSR